jgi:hypothetical protein
MSMMTGGEWWKVKKRYLGLLLKKDWRELEKVVVGPKNER